MKPSCCTSDCAGCTARVICRCFQITEAVVVEAITTLGLRTVKEIRQHIEAGDGCTCCHPQLRRCLAENAPVLTGEAG
jgi:bacterioferritin-associated ferredoxin